MDLLAAPVFHCVAGKNRSIIFVIEKEQLSCAENETFRLAFSYPLVHGVYTLCYGMVRERGFLARLLPVHVFRRAVRRRQR
jgi:hypothetical protein